MSRPREVKVDLSTMQVLIDGFLFGHLHVENGEVSYLTPEGGRGVDFDRHTLAALSAVMAQIEADQHG